MKKRGIALGGGGARGAYQIGALRALKEKGYLENIHAISGASIGSVNAALLAMDDLSRAEEIWLTLDEDRLLKNRGGIIRRLVEERLEFVRQGVYGTDHWEAWLDELLDYDKIRKKNVYVATSYVGEGETSFLDLMTLNLRDFFGREGLVHYLALSEMDDERIRKTLLASCAIPIFFKPVVIDDKTYYDGGILDNTPVRPLIDAGCEEIIVIDLFLINLSRRRIFEGVPLFNLYPKRHLRGVLNFEHEQIQRRYDLGYNETKERLEKDPPF